MIGFEKCKWEHSCGYELCMPEFCKEYEAVPMTNADHIRSMSDEELAETLITFASYGECYSCEGCPLEGSGVECWHDGGILNWLKQPYKENEE